MAWDGVEHRKDCRCVKEKEIGEMHVAIFGNGNIKTGLRYKIESNTEFIDGLKRVFWGALIIAMTGALSAVALFALTVIRIAHGKLG